MPSQTNPIQNFLALDVGEKRIGVALGNSIARLASPLATIINDETVLDRLKSLVSEHKISLIVVGNPRDMRGNSTSQTTFSKAFADKLNVLELPIVFQDESLTSVEAEAELRDRGQPFEKQDIDSVAAALILRDYLGELPVGGSHVS